MTEALKIRLERFGEENDRKTAERSRKMLNITRNTGEFLAVLVHATAANHILEIGTSNGYSTLWLAEAAQTTGGTVTTVEYSEFKVGLAEENFGQSGVDGNINLVHDDAGNILLQADDHAFDLIFLDSERSEYSGWWPHLRRILRPGGLLVVDNAISHQEEIASFMKLVNSDSGFTTCLVPVGKGEYLAVKKRV